jgi:hypothetical protein
LLTHQDASPGRWWWSCACSARERVEWPGWLELDAREDVGVACVCLAVAGSLCGACVCVWGLDARSRRVAGAARVGGELLSAICQLHAALVVHAVGLEAVVG